MVIPFIAHLIVSLLQIARGFRLLVSEGVAVKVRLVEGLPVGAVRVVEASSRVEQAAVGQLVHAHPSHSARQEGAWHVISNLNYDSYLYNICITFIIIIFTPGKLPSAMKLSLFKFPDIFPTLQIK